MPLTSSFNSPTREKRSSFESTNSLIHSTDESLAERKNNDLYMTRIQEDDLMRKAEYDKNVVPIASTKSDQESVEKECENAEDHYNEGLNLESKTESSDTSEKTEDIAKLSAQVRDQKSIERNDKMQTCEQGTGNKREFDCAGAETDTDKSEDTQQLSTKPSAELKSPEFTVITTDSDINKHSSRNNIYLDKQSGVEESTIDKNKPQLETGILFEDKTEQEMGKQQKQEVQQSDQIILESFKTENMEENMSVDTCDPLRIMPGRGKKRGRSSDSSEVTPDAKKRAMPQEDEKKKVKVTHHTHPDFTVPGIPLTLGEGDVGQLGLGEDIMERTRPAHVKLDDKIVQVCAGGMHTVCLTNKGEIITFGCNDESGLGRDTSEEGSETYPAKLDLSYKVVQTSAGDSHTAILTEDGHVYAWGNFRDANGSMGLTSGGIRKEPLEMCPGETVVKIVSGGDHLVCLTNKGEIFTGGCAEQGQLGRVAECFAGRGSRRGVDSILKMGPVRCKKHGSRKHATFSDIWAGQYVTFAKEKESGDIYSWGLNNYFQIGFDDMQNRFIPEWVPSFAAHNKKWIKIQAGQHHTMLLDEDGKVYTIGRAEYGRLGLGENSGEKSEPTLVKTLTEKCIDIAAGQSVSLALTADGTVYGWGMGTSRQLGTGDEEDVWEPVKMSGKQLETRTVVGISAGGQHTVLLAKDNS
ncbi:RCC1 [Mytilus coruscus]|uniref:RCC1 n=1 Tax=Mytilus coruscus TaxID=42192 RepID=A0A6J8ETT8_MYTCO|nr:RCC1 [Mytilus coruscus]